MTWARVAIFLWEAARERNRLHRVARTLGLPVFGTDSLRALRALKPDATTAFILGTGASAADLSNQKLEYIQSQFSIGVNQWIFHPTIPDVYAYEVDPDVRLLKALDRPEMKEKAPYLLFLKPSRPEDFSNASNLPEFMRERTFLYSRVNIWTRRATNIGRDFRAITSPILRQLYSQILLDNGASVARLVALCKQLGYPEIVLVGVDLNSTEYFWHRCPNLLEGAGVEDPITNQSGSFHETLTATDRPFPIDIYVGGLSAKLAEHGTAVSVESKSSLLADLIPVFDWRKVFRIAYD